MFISPSTSQVRGPSCTVQTPHWHCGSEAYRVLQPDNHWFPCDLSPLCLFSPSCHYMKEDFLQCPYWSGFSYYFMSPGFMWTRELRSLCRPVVLCVLWQVHCPRWDGMHGWLTLTQPICHPHRGGGGYVCVCVCVCALVCLCVSVCICSHTDSVWPSHNASVMILHMTLKGAGVDICPIVSGNPTLLLLISPLEETQLLIRMKTCSIYAEYIPIVFISSSSRK